MMGQSMFNVVGELWGLPFCLYYSGVVEELEGVSRSDIKELRRELMRKYDR